MRVARWLLILAVGIAGCSRAGAPSSGAVPARLRLFLLAGQSNMAGRGTVNAPDRLEHPRVLMLNRSREWIPAAEPMHFDKAIAGVGPGRAFGLAIAEADGASAIGLIPAAVGGSPIASWEPGALDGPTATHPCDDAIARARAAMTSGTLEGILWHQGEWGAAKTRVDSVHRALASSMENVLFVSSEELTDKGDTLHFDAPSARELGRRYAEAFLSLRRPSLQRGTERSPLRPE